MSSKKNYTFEKQNKPYKFYLIISPPSAVLGAMATCRLRRFFRVWAVCEPTLHNLLESLFGGFVRTTSFFSNGDAQDSLLLRGEGKKEEPLLRAALQGIEISEGEISISYLVYFLLSPGRYSS